MSGRKNPVHGVFLAFIGGASALFGLRFGTDWLILAGLLTLAAAGFLLIRASSRPQSGKPRRGPCDTAFSDGSSKNDRGDSGSGTDEKGRDGD